MSKITNNKNMKRIGFTLVELLAVLAILSLVSTIGIYTAINIIDSAKENSYNVTVNNIEDNASGYVLEDKNTISWMDGITNTYQYQCVTVQNLIDAGYFKGDVLDSYVAENVKVQTSNYIYLERDKNNKTLTKKVLLVGDKLKLYGGLCDNISPDGNISFIISPSGWSKSKNIVVNYTIYNNMDNVSNYKYDYVYNKSSVDNNFNKLVMEEKLIVNENGILYATIKDKANKLITNNTLSVTKIDKAGPVISDNYSGDSVVRKSVVIPIKVTDSQSGVDGNSFTLADVVVTIGSTTLSSGVTLNKIDNNNYNLIINNNTNAGEVKITIEKNKVFDLIVDEVKNGNDKTVLTPGVSFSNTYKIKYNTNGGTGSMSDTECTYGSNCTLRKNTFTKSGYKFLGWVISSTGSVVDYEDEDSFKYSLLSDLELFAVWEKNTYKIKYNTNGGTGSMSDTECTYGSNCTLRKNTFTRTGYKFLGWVISSTGSVVDYEDEDSFEYSLLSDLELFAVWEKNTYKIKYNTNGGTGSMSDTECTYGSNCTLRKNTFTKSGYKFLGWVISSTGSVVDYEDEDSFKYSLLSDLELFAAWEKNTYKIKYNSNGGTGSMSDTECTNGSDCTLRKNTFTRTGYTFKGWGVSATATTISYSDEDKFTANLSANLELYAIWQVNKYKVKYNSNGGAGNMSEIECTYGSDCTLSNNSFTRTGYTFKGWATSATSSTVSYTNKAKFKYNLTSDLQLYAVWKDETAPTITLGTDGTTKWQKSVSSTITVTDSGSGVNTTTLKYIFSTSNTANPTTAFTNGGTVSLKDVSDKYYLRIYACDNAGNCTTKTSKVFKLDNIPPTVVCDNSVASVVQTINSDGSKHNLGIVKKEECAIYVEALNAKGSAQSSGWDTLIESDNNSIYDWDYDWTIINEDGVEVDNLRRTLGNCDDGYCRWIYTVQVWDQAGNSATGSFTYMVTYE